MGPQLISAKGGEDERGGEGGGGGVPKHFHVKNPPIRHALDHKHPPLCTHPTRFEPRGKPRVSYDFYCNADWDRGETSLFTFNVYVFLFFFTVFKATIEGK